MLNKRILPLAVAAFIAAALSTHNESQAIVINTGETARVEIDHRDAPLTPGLPYVFTGYNFFIKFAEPAIWLVPNKLYVEFRKSDGTAIGGRIINGNWHTTYSNGADHSLIFSETLGLNELVGYLLVTSMEGTYDLEWEAGYFQGLGFYDPATGVRRGYNTGNARDYTAFTPAPYNHRNLELHRLNVHDVPDATAGFAWLAGALSLFALVRHRIQKSNKP